ncbi:hypothetical protein FQA39_LY12296 [Lamprigera yunnana]|nr:hypothetical protein FQA39_LY12296 [Lamprigera yunnana]
MLNALDDIVVETPIYDTCNVHLDNEENQKEDEGETITKERHLQAAENIEITCEDMSARQEVASTASTSKDPIILYYVPAAEITVAKG